MSKICNRCDAVNDDATKKCINCDYEFKEIEHLGYENKDEIDKKIDKEIEIDIIEKFLDNPKEERRPKRKKKNKLPWIVFGFLIPGILIGSFFLFFYNFIFGVEHYSPEAYLNQYLDMVKTKDYENLMKYIEFKADTLNNAPQFSKYIDDEYGDNPEKMRIAKSMTPSTDDAVYYNIQAKGKDVKEMKLVKTGKRHMNYFDEWKVEDPEKDMYTKSVKIHTPKGIEIYVNGALISDSDEYLVESEAKNYDAYAGVKDENYSIPKEICYEVGNLISVDSVEAKKSGAGCAVTLEDNVANVTVGIPDSEVEYFKQLAEEVSKVKSEYICEEANFTQLRVYLHENTEFFATMKEFYNGWFPLHDTYAYDGETRFSNLTWYDENHCSVRVEIDCYVTLKGKRTDYPVRDEVFFTKIGDKWLATNIINF